MPYGSETQAPVPAVPAATVVLLRDGDNPADGFEVLMLKRVSRGAFGGYWVFPGGRVDAEDADELATAVREAKEETGLDLDPTGFVRLSHWLPPAVEMRRFATWFFVARAPHDHGDVQIAEHEVTEHEWVRPIDMLARRDRGEIELAPPTFVTLSTIGAHTTIDDALAAVRSCEPTFFETRLLRTDEPRRAFTIWAGDMAYEDPELIDADGPRHRLDMTAGVWVYERD